MRHVRGSRELIRSVAHITHLRDVAARHTQTRKAEGGDVNDDALQHLDGTGVKVWVQMELARWSILTGKPALEGFAHVPPRLGRVSWINVLWILMDGAKILQRAAASSAARRRRPRLRADVRDPRGHARLRRRDVRQIVPAHTATAAGRWERFYGPGLAGRILGVIGFGRIGQAVARRATG